MCALVRRVSARLSWSLVVLGALGASACSGPEAEPTEIVRQAAVSTPAFVQRNSSDPQSPVTSLAVPFTAAQTAGNLNVVIVGWNDTTAQVVSVTDTKGNTYVRAVGPTTSTNVTQSIYYAKNIVAAAANANSVTVTFNVAAQFVDIRQLEYSGIDPVNPVDVVATGSGNSASSSTTAVTTTAATDLLVAGNMVHTWTTGAGSGFTNRVITNPDSDLAEDRVVTAVGSYSATAPLGQSGIWIMQMVAFRAAGQSGDTTAPTAPSGLTATAASSTQINLSFTAATDNVGVTNYLVERCQGAGCSTFAQIGTSATTTFSDTGRTPSTSYSYRVRATDAAGNLGPFSSTASATTPAAPDTTAPSAPSGLTATAASSTQINLSFTAATDNVGVTSYLVERCQGAGCSSFSQIGTSATTTFSDPGLTASTSYSYRVRATDAAGNLGAFSNTASATTQAPPDTTPPTAPSGLSALAVSSTQINVSFTAATDNVGVTSYLVERCQGAGCSSFAQIGTSMTTTFSDASLTASSSYSYRVRATDAAGNLGPFSSTASATTQAPPDTTPPTAPASLAATAASSTQVNLSWSAATDNVGVTGYLVERCQGAGCSSFAQIGTSPTTTFSDAGLTASTSYSYRVRATDSAGNLGGFSNTASATTQAPPDTTPPTAPTLGASASSSTQIDLSWTAATDNVGVTGYLVERCQGAGCSSFAQITTTAATTFSDTGRTPSTSYSYRVRATDAAGNLGAFSSTATATTPAPPDTTPPSAPSSLTATAPSSNQIDLSFTAATDNVGVTSYLVERCQGAGCSSFAQIGTTGATSFTDSGLTTAVSYSYRVRATDAAGNLGAFSNTATATPPDTTAPTAPASLTATASSSSQVDLAWSAATDNIGVTSYLVERCQGAACSSFAQIGSTGTTAFSDTGRTPSTSYSYRVRATDAAGNLGGFSNSATASTPAAPDTTPPTAPSSLAATAASSTQINVSWGAATDNVGVTSYLVERCQGAGCATFTQVATTAATSFGDAGLTASTGYSYRVRATDAAGNLGPFSSTASATTQAPPDTTPPTAPSSVVATAASSTQINLSFTAATDNVAVTSYLVERCQGAGCSSFAQIGTSMSTTFNDASLTASSSYSYRVRASDAAGNLGPFSNTASATTQAPPDTTPPTAPSSLAATAASSTQVNLSWTASTDNVAVTNYLVERCQGAGCSSFAQIGTSASTTFSDAGLTASTSYSYRVRATDSANNLSGFSNTASATTQAPPDTTPPTAPTLSATASSSTQVNLSWTAATDNVGVTGYLVERCQGAGCSSFAQITTTAATTFSDTGRTPSTSYSYRVRATDAAGNLGPFSSAATAATPAAPDTTPPTAPASLAATAASGTQVNLSFTAATDNVGVTNYLVERCQGVGCSSFTQIGTTAAASFSDTGLTSATIYGYRVRATDAAGNLGPFSNTATASTPDTVAPTAPSSLVATAASSTQINLSWTAATDNVGVTGYLVERCQGAGCSSFSQVGNPAGTSFNDAGLVASTSYSYRVRATDGTNLGPFSSTATATTQGAADTTAPTAPSSLVAGAASGSQITLTWTAATDNVGVTGYLVERCQGAGCSTFAQVGTSSTTNLSDTGLVGSTSYSYRVRARDAANNLGAFSNTASATTLGTLTPAFVQVAAADPQSTPSSVAVTYAQAQTAGNLNVVIVGWNDITANVGSVTDSKGNVYTLAVGPTRGTGISQSIYYARNIVAAAANGNAVTVTFTPAAAFPDVRILEYRNVDPVSPLDVTSTGTGSGGTSSTTAVTTTNAVDLLVAGNMVGQWNIAAGSGWTSRIITNPDSDLAEDRVVTTAGSQSATAVLGGSGVWLMQMVAFKAASQTGDTTAPTAPSSLTASAPSSSQINLSWTAATDNVGVTSYLVERCQGAGCSSFAQVGTSVTTSFNDTGLLASTSYSYRVRASDAAANLGPFSSTATASTLAAPDTTPPTAPTGLTASAVSSSQVDLSWTGATDNVGVTNYLVERCQGAGCSTFTQIGTSATTAFSDTAVVPTTTYGYRVRATDAAGNLGGFSLVASATTPAAPDTTPPSAPTGLSALAVSSTQINLSWTASTDNVSVAAYLVERCQGTGCSGFAQIAVALAPSTSLSDSGLSPSSTYSYRVRAVDNAGNQSVPSNTASVAMSDTTPPTAPGSLTVSAVSSTQINLSWTAATDDVGVMGYLIERCQGAGCSSFGPVGSSFSTTFSDTGLAASTSYTYRVRATDLSNNTGPPSNTASATTQAAPDTSPPTAPANLTATPITDSQIDLAWTASTDNVGVTSYLVERCQGGTCTNFVQVATAAGTSYSDTGLLSWTRYRYRVRATDAASNLGDYSAIASAITPFPPDVTPPSDPSNLTATAASSTSVNLAWTASTDDQGVQGYLIERCQGSGCGNFAQVGTSSGAAFVDTGLTPSTGYNYRVRARDATGNLSGYSNTAGAATPAAPDTTAPTAPANLTATAMTDTRIDLAWTAATDNVGVASYLIERCQGSGCSNFAQIGTSAGTTFSDNGLLSSTAYSYRVRATDAAGNLGAFSGTASATTPVPPDLSPPTDPTNLTATVASPTQVNLAWTASTDDVGVATYFLERCQGTGCSSFGIIATNSTTSFADSSLVASGTYSYRVRATDAAGNFSGYSNVASATTGSQQTVTPAFVQVAAVDPQSAQTTVNVTYAAAQSAGNLNVVIVGWNDVNAQVATVTDSKGNSYTRAVGPTQQGTTLSQSIYYAKNIVAAAGGSNVVSVTFNTAAQFPDVRVLEYSGIDQVSPVDATAAGTGAGGTSTTTANLTTTGTNALLVAGNLVSTTTASAGTGFTSRIITSPDGDIAEDRVAANPGTYNASANLAGSGAWLMQVVAFKAALSGGTDTQAPTAPSSLTALAASSSQINLTWTGSTDNVGVSNYLIERCQGAGCSTFAQVALSPSPSFTDTGLLASTSYSYRVRATDAANNLSGFSNTGTATTLAPADTTAPTAPGSLTATTGTNRIDLAWTAATDNVGVTNYLVERCQGAGCASFAQIGTAGGTSFSDTGLLASTSYSYRVRATDAAANLGPFSNMATAIAGGPSDTTPPSNPSALAASAASASQIALGWTASTDNVGVTGYLVERCQGTGCSNFTQVASPSTASFTDGSLQSSTTYTYRVRATDAAGNLSGYSNTASASTSSAPASPAFVQSNWATPHPSATTVNVTFTSNQQAGDLNVVAVGVNDSNTQITSVTDTRGNVYVRAVGPTVVNGKLSQSMYYAKNIASAGANGNTVTVAFNNAGPSPDVRIVEYSGVDPSNPVDVVAAGSGTSAVSGSGPATTTNAFDLLVGANMVETVTAAPGTGYTQRIFTQPNADLLEDRMVTSVGTYDASATLTSSGAWVMQMVAFKAGGAAPPPDTTPPVVTVAVPSAGATLSGSTTVTVTATDTESGVGGVQLLVDGIAVGPPDTSSPYSITFDTTKLGNGAHTIGAYAWDGQRNVGSASPVSVTFSNASPADPTVVGMWSGLLPLPVVSVHSALLPNGRVLMSDGQPSFGKDARVWDVMTSAFVNNVGPPVNIFCGAHEQMGDGRIFWVGGHVNAHVGLAAANIFNPATNAWTVLPDMANPRWYPSVTALPDGRFFVLAGESACNDCWVNVPEIYNPGTNSWSQLSSASQGFPYYPHVYVLPDGRIFVPSTTEEPIVSKVLDLGTNTWSPVGGPAVDGGSSAMYQPWKFIKEGTSTDPDLAVRSTQTTTFVLDMTQPSPVWQQVQSMHHPRTFHVTTLLPDGNVLVTGGGPSTAATDTANAVMPAELWSPTTQTWTEAASMHAARLYHSTALLVPDGRVLISGGGRFDDTTLPTDQFTAEFFLPPYLFKGPRPTITAAPPTVGLGQVFTVQTPNAAEIASVVLIRYGAVTHHINMGQRMVPLSFSAGSSSLTVTAPASANLVPPGNYMLFIVNGNGVPSVAATIKL
jgi:chitodextrinase